MFSLLRLWMGALVRLFRSRQGLLIENLALRQQLAVFKRQCGRPSLTGTDKLFWLLLHRFWSSWKTVLVAVSPDTVVRWHRAGFHLYWRLISRVRKRVGRRPVTAEIRKLIFKMMAENPTWRAPRIHGELVMLGFEVSERSLARWMRRGPTTADPSQHWLTFLRNHREAIAAMDFFTMPTITFGVLYCLIGGAFSTSTLPAIPPAPGSCNSYAKPFPTKRRSNFLSSITTQSTAPKFQPRFAR